MVSLFSGCLGPHATAALHRMGFPAVSANAAALRHPPRAPSHGASAAACRQRLCVESH